MSVIFISHRNAPLDNEWAERIHRWIKDQKNIDGFLDFDVQDGLQAGGRWEENIYAAMHRAQIIIALISPAWLESHWCTSEARMAKLLGRKLIPIEIAKCKNPFSDIQSIRLERGEEKAFEQLRQALRTTYRLPRRPYPGLSTFEEEDAAVFFGRYDEIHDLANQIDSLFNGRPHKPRLLLILGASGSGKSSLLRAGLIPEFKANRNQLVIDPIIPRGAPLDELAYALDVSFDGLGSADAAETILKSLKSLSPGFERAIIPIDQAEELLQGQQSFFFDVLRLLLDKANGRVVVLAAMRSDFLNEFQKSDLIGANANLNYEHFTLDPLPNDRLNDIISKPAKLFGKSFQDGLVTRIVQDHGGPDALPLLAFFLNEFWRRDFIEDGVLQLSEYESFGGLNRAIQKAVDRAITECTKIDPSYSDQRRLLTDLEDVFLGLLVSVNSVGGEAIRNRVAAAALSKHQTNLLTTFAQQRLLIEKDGVWEVVHESLFRQWEDLARWIDTAREDLVAINRLQLASAQWDDAGRQDADLTHFGSRLYDANDMKSDTRYKRRFSSVDIAYIDAAHSKEKVETEQRKSLIDSALNAQSDYLAEYSTRSLKDGDWISAVTLVLEAVPDQFSPLLEQREKKLTKKTGRTLFEIADYIAEQVFIAEKHEKYDRCWNSADGKYHLASRGCSIFLFETWPNSGLISESTLPYEIKSVAFSASGKMAAVLFDYGLVRLIQIPSLKAIADITAPIDSRAISVSWSGKIIALESLDGSISVIKPATDDFDRMPTRSLVLTPVHKPDTSSTVVPAPIVFDSFSRSTPFTGLAVERPALVVHEGEVLICTNSFWISPDGNELRLYKYNQATPFQKIELPGSPRNANLSYNERFLAVEVVVEDTPQWCRIDLNSPIAVELLDASPNSLCHISNEGRALIYGNRVILIHELDSSSREISLSDYETYSYITLSRKHELTISPDGRWVGLVVRKVGVERNGPQFLILNCEHPETQQYSEKIFDGEGAGFISFSPDSKWVAICGHSATAHVFELGNFSQGRKFNHGQYYPREDGVRALAFSADSSMVSTGFCHNEMRVWELMTGSLIFTAEMNAGVKSVGFSPDNTFSFSLDDKGRLQILYVDVDATRANIALPSSVDSALFNKEGDLVATLSAGGFAVFSLSMDNIIEQIGAAVPRALGPDERGRRDLPPDLPIWCARYRKFPVLAGEDLRQGHSFGSLIAMARAIVVDEYSARFRSLINHHEIMADEDIIFLADVIWSESSATISYFVETRGLNHNNMDFELAAESFLALLEVAELYRPRTLPTKMLKKYSGPWINGMNRWRR